MLTVVEKAGLRNINKIITRLSGDSFTTNFPMISKDTNQSNEENAHQIVLEGFLRIENKSVCKIEALIQLFGLGNAVADSLIHSIASGPLPRTPIFRIAIANEIDTNFLAEIFSSHLPRRESFEVNGLSDK
jgi:hypothetical protein